MLAEALEQSTLVSAEGQSAVGDEHLTMATAYLEDGRHFREQDDYVTALASFSYGHGWLDAGIRAGFIDDTGQTSEPRDM